MVHFLYVFEKDVTIDDPGTSFTKYLLAGNMQGCQLSYPLAKSPPEKMSIYKDDPSFQQSHRLKKIHETN